MRILHGPANVGNQPWTLSRAERTLGHTSDVVQNYGTWIGYPADRTLGAYAKRSPQDALRRMAFALSAPFRYDVLHYSFGRTFMLWDDWGMQYGRSGTEDWRALADLKLARLLGRRIFMTLQGCDIRMAGQSEAVSAVTMCAEGRCPAYAGCRAQVDDMRAAMKAVLLPLVDRTFFLNPELGHFLEGGDFLPYANVDIHAFTPNLPRTDRPTRIVHAPSSPGLKGTPRIMAALDALKTRFDFEFVLIENKPHVEALEIYRSADLAIDQIYAGWYGGFAVEVMAMGTPVAAYIREEDRKFVPDAMWNEIPILRLHPDTLESDLARILRSRTTLPEAGYKSRRYVERWHDPLKIARALTRIYQDPSAPLRIDNE